MVYGPGRPTVRGPVPGWGSGGGVSLKQELELACQIRGVEERAVVLAGETATSGCTSSCGWSPVVLTSG